jgi:hypothetical protein
MCRTMFGQILYPILKCLIFVLDESLIDLSVFEVIWHTQQLVNISTESLLTGDVTIDADTHLLQLETNSELVAVYGESKNRLTTL